MSCAETPVHITRQPFQRGNALCGGALLCLHGARLEIMLGNVGGQQHLCAVILLLHSERGCFGGIGIAAFAPEDIGFPRCGQRAGKHIAVAVQMLFAQPAAAGQPRQSGSGAFGQRIVHAAAAVRGFTRRSDRRPQIGAGKIGLGTRFGQSALGDLNVVAIRQALFNQGA